MLSETEYQTYCNIKSTSNNRWNYFTFKNFYGNINDRKLFKQEIPIDCEGYELTTYVTDILMPFILVRARNAEERKLYQIVLYNIDNTLSLYDIAKHINFKNNIEFSMRRLRAIVNKEHREYCKEVNDL
ncbi:MAG: hypothetical protein IIT65_12715 [Lachnospiraceae bacterium]|nr:hypothetical protein [Lachnospiraceae bacterium]